MCSSFLEEDAGPAVFEVRRSDGTIGEVSVTVTTVDATAVSPMGIYTLSELIDQERIMANRHQLCSTGYSWLIFSVM